MWSGIGDGQLQRAQQRKELSGGDAVRITIEERDCVSILQLDGDLTSRGNLKRNVERFMGRRCHRIVLDLSGVPMISSAGLADLMELTARSNSQGGRLVLLSPSPFVEGVLAATKLDKYFEVYSELDSALCALK